MSAALAPLLVVTEHACGLQANNVLIGCVEAPKLSLQVVLNASADHNTRNINLRLLIRQGHQAHVLALVRVDDDDGLGAELLGIYHFDAKAAPPPLSIISKEEGKFFPLREPIKGCEPL